jgi:N-sulfoglucosamine sulfohydrolase
MDQGVGMVLEALAQSGKADNTLVIYLSDNGMPFPGAKTTLYDAGVKLPFIARVPGRKAGIVSEAMVSWIDIAPTVLEWTGVKEPQYGLPGRSILPILDQQRPSGWDHVFASHTMHEVWMNYPMRMVRTREYKLIWNLNYQLNWPIAGDINGSPSQKAVNRLASMGKRSLDTYIKRPEFELYDMKNDPQELKNLAADQEHAKVRQELSETLLTMMKETKDPWMPLVKER